MSSVKSFGILSDIVLTVVSPEKKMASITSNQLGPNAQLEILKDIIKQGGRVYLSLAGHELIAQVKIDNGEYKLTTSHRELNPPYCSERKKILFLTTGVLVTGTKIEGHTPPHRDEKYETTSKSSELSSAEVRDTLLNLKKIMKDNTPTTRDGLDSLHLPKAS